MWSATPNIARALCVINDLETGIEVVAVDWRNFASVHRQREPRELSGVPAGDCKSQSLPVLTAVFSPAFEDLQWPAFS